MPSTESRRRATYKARGSQRIKANVADTRNRKYQNAGQRVYPVPPDCQRREKFNGKKSFPPMNKCSLSRIKACGGSAPTIDKLFCHLVETQFRGAAGGGGSCGAGN